MASELALVIRATDRVVGHRDTAHGAFYGVSTASAAEEIVISAPVQKENGLSPTRFVLNESAAEHLAERRKVAGLRLRSHIIDRDGGKHSLTKALLQLYESVFALDRLFIAFDRWGCRGEKHKYSTWADFINSCDV